MSDARPIGVFDSGVGGLTVLAALRSELETESFVYLGDTARVPYGTREPGTVTRYAVNNARALTEGADIKALVVACNTASAVALPALRARFDIPVLGVIGPGAEAAVDASVGGTVHILATRGTVRSGAYVTALEATGYARSASQTACPLLVALVEEGWTEGPITDAVIARYIADVPASADTVVLGCTHFPLLRASIERALPGRRIVDGGARTAQALARALAAEGCLSGAAGPGTLAVWVTDGRDQMLKVGPRFLGQGLASEDVHLVEVTMPPLEDSAPLAGDKT